MELHLTVGSSPHIKAKHTTTSIMRDVLIALAPAAVMGIIFFGWRALVNIVVAMATCVLTEYIWNRAMKKRQTVGDLSAAVTGLLLALTVSSGTPFWMLIIGGVFAIVLVKQIFGGIGMNFLNPALAARAVMMASWPTAMTTWLVPQWLSGANAGIDAVSGATPLAIQKLIIRQTEGVTSAMLPSLKDLFLGNIYGSIGETCALALLLGFAYLLVRKIISWEIPVVFCGSAVLLSWILGLDPLFNLLSGGMLIGAIFMASDYTTSPMTRVGKVIYAAGGGLISIVIRVFGGYPEGVSYAILLMNLVVPLIDKMTKPRSFGRVKEERQHKEVKA